MINDSLKWKVLQANVTGNTAVDLTKISYSEIYVVAHANGDSNHAFGIFPKITMSENESTMRYLSGGSVAGVDAFDSKVLLTTKTIKLVSLYQDNQNKLGSALMDVYYR